MRVWRCGEDQARRPAHRATVPRCGREEIVVTRTCHIGAPRAAAAWQRVSPDVKFSAGGNVQTMAGPSV
jgi:hypothetical protein